MPERVNCNILQPSSLAQRISILTTEKRRTSHNRSDKDPSVKKGGPGRYEDASLAVKVSRKWRSTADRVRGIFDTYKWFDEVPLGLFIDVWA